MSSITDRQAWRIDKQVSRPAGQRTEAVFWVVLIALTAAMVAGAVVCAANGVKAPVETVLVGP